MCVFGAPSSTGEKRWTPEIVAATEVVVVHLHLAAVGPPPAAAVPDLAFVPALAYNIFL